MLVFWQSLWLRHIIRIFKGSRRTRWAGRMIDAIFTFPASTGIVTEVGVIFLGSGSGGRPIVGRTMVRPWRVRWVGLHFVATLGILLLFRSSSIVDGRRRRGGAGVLLVVFIVGRLVVVGGSVKTLAPDGTD